MCFATLCCVGRSCICLGQTCMISSSKASRSMYFFLFFGAMILSWIARTEGHYWYEGGSNSAVGCEKGMSYNYNACLNKTSVYRISLGVSLFHAIMFFLVVGVKSSKEPRALIQNSFWFFKLAAYGALIVGSFYFPQKNVLEYARTAIFGAAVFILIQCLLLVDLGYSLNEEWVAKSYFATILMLAGFLYSLFFLFIVLSFYYFTGSGCDTNNFLVSFTFVASLIFTGLAVSERINKGILPPALVAAYVAYLVLSALMSEPSKAPCTLDEAGRDSPYMVIAGALLTLASVAIAANRTAGSGNNMKGVSKETLEAGGKVSEDEADDEKEEVAYDYAFFHVTYMLASMFMAMIITNWEITVNGDPNSAAIDQGWTATWVKMATQWTTIIMFIWTLIAPLVCPDRFGNA